MLVDVNTAKDLWDSRFPFKNGLETSIVRKESNWIWFKWTESKGGALQVLICPVSGITCMFYWGGSTLKEGGKRKEILTAESIFCFEKEYRDGQELSLPLKLAQCPLAKWFC